MDHRLSNSHGAGITKKSRSLDLKSLYETMGSKDDKNKHLKRKGGLNNGGDGKKQERKKSRKEVSVNNFKSISWNSSKSLEEVYNRDVHSSSHDLKDTNPGLSQRWTDSNGFSRISFALDNGFFKIPRRKRGFVGRRKTHNGSQVLKPAEESSGKVGNVDDVAKSACENMGKRDDSSKGKGVDNFDDFKEDKCCALNSHRDSEEECGHASHSVVDINNLEKPHTADPVEDNGDSSLGKSLRKRSRKREALAFHGRSVGKEAEPLDDTSVKMADCLRDEDEENLEENAARMLSSRFDPSCMGFLSNGKSAALASANGLSFFTYSSQEINSRGSNPVSGSESASIDTTGRVLRPRKHHNEKDNTRKQRRYYEVPSVDLDASWVLNRRIKVFWPLDKIWYYGLVSDYNTERKLHHVKYDDRDEEWINLQNERFKLLLLPSEVPCKPQWRKSAAAEKCFGGEKGKLKPIKERKRDLMVEDDRSVGNSMDSEPIISWLNHRVKYAPLHAFKKQKICGLSLTVPLLSPEAGNRWECCDGESVNDNKRELFGNSALPNRLATAGKSEDSAMDNYKHSKPTVVYYRKRFRMTSNVFCRMLEDDLVCPSVPEPDTSLVSNNFVSGPMGEASIALRRWDPDVTLENLDACSSLWSTDSVGRLKLNTLLVESRGFEFSFSVFSVLNFSFGADISWLSRTVLLLQHGTLVTIWPRVNLEMLFIDNIVGLRFLLFEGCLLQALALIFVVLTVFCHLDGQQKYADMQFPVTSIRLKISYIQGFKKQLVFVFYNFSEVENSKWLYMDYKLKERCLLAKQLPLSKCTHNNVKLLQNRASQSVGYSIFRDPTSYKGQQLMSRQCISLIGVSKEPTYADDIHSSYKFDKNHRSFPQFVLSFAAAPTFFLGLHLKLLMEHSATHISFLDNDSAEHLESSSNLLADDSSNKASEDMLHGHGSDLLMDAVSGGCLSSMKPESHHLDVHVNNIDDRMTSSLKLCNGDGIAETSVSSKDMEKIGNGCIVPLQNGQWNHLESEKCTLLPGPLVDRRKSDTGSHSLLNGITVDIPSSQQFDKHVERTHQSTELHYKMNGGIIPSPNPTARRSASHRARSSSSSFGYHWHGLSDGKVASLQNNFGNRPKKPRTNVSHAMPFGGFDYGSKNKSHQQKGFSHKRIRTATEKGSSDFSRGFEQNMEMLSCDANLLITLSERGWRECGAQVVLELFDHNEWKLAVKLSGTTRYSYKAHQFLQTGSTNRYTHAMMWKGGKDWTLEFTDRSQWALFKEMHEECYNRNIRAASVKNIPIPGVHLIEENDDHVAEVPFVRSSSKYFRQLETDVEMALNPSRVMYDIDSDDEQWMSKNQSPSAVDNGSVYDISEEIFVKTMDMLEKAAYSQQCDQFKCNELEELMAGFGPMEAVKTIHEYWRQKRQRKGMPLIRHFQPPLWERYQQLLREWELAMAKSNMTLLNGCQEKAAAIEKPAMFAFCLKPRGLEVPNKGSKQRSQKKLSVAWQSNAEQDGFHICGRKLNGFASGDERYAYLGYNCEPVDDSLAPQISPKVFPPQDVGSIGHLSKGGHRYDRHRLQKLHRSKSQKIGVVKPPKDAQVLASNDQRMFDRRNGVNLWNMGLSDWPSQRPYPYEGPLRYVPEQLDGSDLDEFRVRDASGVAKHAVNIAKLKREKAQRMLYRADLAIHRAVVALMTAEAIKASSEEFNGKE
uniref:Enhancer of polycomb-like protein n=2 Tax=Rhizophora mucronata TaxID=61149 RepID=A0A2P2MIF8_RHIMU